jgi:plasmid stabilization system protein ParE
VKKKPAIFHPDAEAEFLAAVAYYAEKAGGLGDRFYQEIRRLVAEIEAAPRRHGPWRHGTRRHRARRFPYAVIFAERPDRLHLVAVAHVKRHPDYWRERLT